MLRQAITRTVRVQGVQQTATMLKRNVSTVPDTTYTGDAIAKNTAPKQSADNFQTSFYNNVFSRSSVYYTFFFTCAVFVNLAWDHGFEFLWDQANQGKQFRDVIPTQFPNLPPGTEPEDQ